MEKSPHGRRIGGLQNEGQKEKPEKAVKEAQLYEQIGRLKMELEWLKKKLPASTEMKKTMIEKDHPSISTRRQCRLVGLSRSTYYREAKTETLLNLELMRGIDEQYLKTPFCGVRRMTVSLQRQGYQINHKRIARLMRDGASSGIPTPKPLSVGQGTQDLSLPAAWTEGQLS